MTGEDWLAFYTAETCHVHDKPHEGGSVRDTATLRVNIEGQPITPATAKSQNHQHPRGVSQPAGL